MTPGHGGRRGKRSLPVLSAALGVAVGLGILLASFTFVASDGRMYWKESVTVPGDANAAHPFQGSFRGASYSGWWPPAAAAGSASTGLRGVDLQITEPSGIVESTSTGCGACGPGPQYWYTSDGTVGILFTDGSFGDLTLLVAA